MRLAVLLPLFCAALEGATDAQLRRLVAAGAGVVVLPAGEIEISSEIVLPGGARGMEIRGAPGGTTLRASDAFRGRAVFVCRGGVGVRFADFAIDGNRAALEVRSGLPASSVPFARFTANNGILAEDVRRLSVERVRFSNIAGFAVLVKGGAGASLRGLAVSDSGSRNAAGRNNTTGGILIEEGTAGFEVLDCALERVRGNGIWTHSLYTSPRSRDGLIRGNRFSVIARDAIQVGHATRVRVEENTGRRIGWPVEEVDAEGGGTPVAIDTAGNVDASHYSRNSFEEINGKCIDLDGFHHGSVRENTCVNRGRAEDYPFGHYAIVMNNTNPDMQSESIVIAGNRIDGAKFGGIFVIGSHHEISGNEMRRLNLAGCNENRRRFGCSHFPGEPDLLQTGIYLGRRAERPAAVRANIIGGNVIAGHRMKTRCVAAAPGVSLAENTIAGNRCFDGEAR